MKTTKIFITALLLCLTGISNAQDLSFNNIHKLVEAKKFKEAIPQLKNFVTVNLKHVSANYDLALSYHGLTSEIMAQQNANVGLQQTALWTDSNYIANITLWNNGIKYLDSAVYYYKETSALMNIKFLTLDLRYDEFYQATKDCGAIVKVQCARNYLTTVIDAASKANVDNKAELFNVQKNYDKYKMKYCGVYTLIANAESEDGGSITLKYLSDMYVGELTNGGGSFGMNNLVIMNGSISYNVNEQVYNGSIIRNSDGSVEIIVLGGVMKYIKK